MDVSCKSVIIIIVLISTFLNKSGCSNNEDVHTTASTEVSGESPSVALLSVTLPGQTSKPSTQDTTIYNSFSSTTTTKKITSPIVTSISSTVSSSEGTTETQHSKTIPQYLPTETSIRVNVTRLSSSPLLSTSSSSPLTSTSTYKSPDSSSSASVLTTLAGAPSVSTSFNNIVSTEDVSTSGSHTEGSQDVHSDSSPEKIAGIVVGSVCSAITVVVVVIAAFYFKRRKGRKAVVENIRVNYESEKFEDITVNDYDVITLTDSNYEKLQSADPSENQYTMVVREAGPTAEDKLASMEDSSYVLPNQFRSVSGVGVKENGVTNNYEMFSLDTEGDFHPILDENDYIKLSEDDFKGV